MNSSGLLAPGNRGQEPILPVVRLQPLGDPGRQLLHLRNPVLLAPDVADQFLASPISSLWPVLAQPTSRSQAGNTCQAGTVRTCERVLTSAPSQLARPPLAPSLTSIYAHTPIQSHRDRDPHSFRPPRRAGNISLRHSASRVRSTIPGSLSVGRTSGPCARSPHNPLQTNTSSQSCAPPKPLMSNAPSLAGSKPPHPPTAVRGQLTYNHPLTT